MSWGNYFGVHRSLSWSSINMNNLIISVAHVYIFMVLRSKWFVSIDCILCL